MSQELVVPTLWGSHVRVREAVDHDGAIIGVGLDFLKGDALNIRYADNLTRLDALRVALALSEHATAGLEADEATALLGEAMEAFPSEVVTFALEIDNVIPFPAGASFPSAAHGVPAGDLPPVLPPASPAGPCGEEIAP